MAGSIVCGVDETVGAHRAARIAADLADRLALRLVLVHVAPRPVIVAAPAAPYAPAPVSADTTEIEASSRELLETFAVGTRRGDVSLRTEFGDPVEQLLTVADQEAAELIAVGSRGRSRISAALLGSTSCAVASRASCPVLVVPDRADVTLAWLHEGNVVCGVADAASSLAPVELAADLKERLGAKLVLVHVAPPGTLPGVSAVPGARDRVHEVAARDGDALLSEVAGAARLTTGVERRVVFGSPASALLETAADERARLLVVGSRRRGAWKAAVLGSVSSEVAARALCPVVLAPLDETATEERADAGK